VANFFRNWPNFWEEVAGKLWKDPSTVPLSSKILKLSGNTDHLNSGKDDIYTKRCEKLVNSLQISANH
jgi:hypothetical protein